LDCAQNDKVRETESGAESKISREVQSLDIKISNRLIVIFKKERTKVKLEFYARCFMTNALNN